MFVSACKGHSHWFHVPSVQSLMNIVSLIGKTMTGILLSLYVTINHVIRVIFFEFCICLAMNEMFLMDENGY